VSTVCACKLCLQKGDDHHAIGRKLSSTSHDIKFPSELLQFQSATPGTNRMNTIVHLGTVNTTVFYFPCLPFVHANYACKKVTTIMRSGANSRLRRMTSNSLVNYCGFKALPLKQPNEQNCAPRNRQHHSVLLSVSTVCTYHTN